MTSLHLVAADQRRGAEVHALQLATSLVAAGHPARVLALRRGLEGSELGVPALGERPLAPSTLRRLRLEVRRWPITVAHGSSTLPACAAVRAPFVYRTIGDPAYWAGHGLRRYRVGVAVRRARAVVALWAGAADSVMRLHGVPASRIEVIPNAVPAAAFRRVDDAARALARRGLGVPDDRRWLVYIGSLAPEKRVDWAIRAVGALPEVGLLVAGDGPCRADLEAMADRAAGGRVRFLGSVADPALVLQAADVAVLPSRTEGMSAVLIEAAMSGLPAVATDVGGSAEIVEDGRTGVLVPVEDQQAFLAAVSEVLGVAAVMGAAARARCVSRFDLAAVTSAWAALLDRWAS